MEPLAPLKPNRQWGWICPGSHPAGPACPVRWHSFAAWQLAPQYPEPPACALAGTFRLRSVKVEEQAIHSQSGGSAETAFDATGLSAEFMPLYLCLACREAGLNGQATLPDVLEHPAFDPETLTIFWPSWALSVTIWWCAKPPWKPGLLSALRLPGAWPWPWGPISARMCR